MPGIAAQPDPGSFRDPAGRVFLAGSKVYRTVSQIGAKDFRQVMESGILREMAEAGRCVESIPLSASERADMTFSADFGEAAPAEVLAHPCIPFISYPYEWSFEALRAAALAHLDLQLALLKRDFTLSDASAFNMQFLGPEPVHIDTLSIVPYKEGTRWIGYDQFKKHFLNPLVFEASTGVSFAPWFRGTLDGMAGTELVKLLPWRKLLRPSTLIHLVAPAIVDRRALSQPEIAAQTKLSPLPKHHLTALLLGLRRTVGRLSARRASDSPWLDYEATNSYSDSEREAKRAAVAAFVRETRPALLLDVGCNAGEYSQVALEAGAQRVIGAERDRAALDAAFKRAKAGKMNFLPIDLDVANPSPGQGWCGLERRSFTDRLCADGLLALAVIHHLVIAGNLPLSEVVAALVELAPTGVIEFVPKSDPQVQRLLRLRSDIFHDYDISHFASYLGRCAAIVSQTQFTLSGRTLFRYKRNSA